MDGTLLNDKKEVSLLNKEAIKKAHNKGVHIAVCTGRLFTSARYYANLLGVAAPIISSNGAFIREQGSNEVIYNVPLGLENCKEIEKISSKYIVNKYYNEPDTIVSAKGFSDDYLYVTQNKMLPEEHRVNLITANNMDGYIEENSNKILKCIFIDKDYDKLNEIREQLLKIENIEIVSSGRDNIEIMKKGVSKGQAVKKLTNYFNLKREEVICIGDNENDISMIEFAGLGIAMGNGEDKVKALAGYVTDTNNNSGVAKAIEKFIL
jgi:Cof subfamily protein (haloacid dehalogenase superfamily)